jgi:aryl-alcohol dehydrogenase-like predicted oxidoreductase
MTIESSRRDFLAAGLALPAAGGGAAAPALRHRTLGRTGLKVTTVGFGCLITTDSSVISRAIDLGINYFDTARQYQKGNNERMVGGALGARRKNVILSSKVDPEGILDKQGALRDLEISLKELATDYLDIWYLHAKDSPDKITGDLMEAQEIAKKQGKIRFLGVSTHRLPAVAPFILKTGKTDVVMASYNFTMAAEVDPALESLHKAGVGLVAMKVMAGGFRRLRPADKLHSTLQHEGAMLAALKRVLKNPNVDSTVPSMSDAEQLEENLRAMREPFSAADEKALAAGLEEIRPYYCRMCGRCDGRCPQGLPVAEMLRYLTYADGYGQFALGREEFLKLPPQIRQVRCRQCAACTIRCPNGVQVSKRLIRAQELFG